MQFNAFEVPPPDSLLSSGIKRKLSSFQLRHFPPLLATSIAGILPKKIGENSAGDVKIAGSPCDILLSSPESYIRQSPPAHRAPMQAGAKL